LTADEGEKKIILDDASMIEKLDSRSRILEFGFLSFLKGNDTQTMRDP
jgi:hypothetical protein